MFLNVANTHWHLGTIQRNKFADIEVSLKDYHQGLGYDTLQKLPSQIPDISKVLTYSNGYGKAVYGSQSLDFNFFSIDSQFYQDPSVFEWDHFYSVLPGISNPFASMNQTTIIINAVMANKLHISVGDRISADLTYSLEYSGEYLTGQQNSLLVIGIIDRLPISTSFSWTGMPVLFLDDHYQFELQQAQNVAKTVHSVVIDLIASPTHSDQEIIDQIVDFLGLPVQQLQIDDYKNQAVTGLDVFIITNLIFVLLIFPMIIYFSNKTTLQELKPDFVKLGTRGLSDRTIRRAYIFRVMRSNAIGLFYGILLGISLGLEFLRFYLPPLMLKSNPQLQHEILSTIIILVSAMILVNVISLSLVTREIRTVLPEKTGGNTK